MSSEAISESIGKFAREMLHALGLTSHNTVGVTGATIDRVPVAASKESPFAGIMEMRVTGWTSGSLGDSWEVLLDVRQGEGWSGQSLEGRSWDVL